MWDCVLFVAGCVLNDLYLRVLVGTPIFAKDSIHTYDVSHVCTDKRARDRLLRLSKKEDNVCSLKRESNDALNQARDALNQAKEAQRSLS